MQSRFDHFLLLWLGVVTVVVDGAPLHAVDRAPLLEEVRLADLQAAAEESLAKAFAERSAGNLARMDQLLRSGDVSWRAVAKTRSDAIRDSKRVVTINQFRKWLRRLHESADDVAPQINSEFLAVAHLDLAVPGSQAMLAWVRPERLNASDREALFDLLVRRSTLVAETQTELEKVRRQVAYVTQRRERLQLSVHGSSVELDQVASEQSILQARLVLEQTGRDRRRCEHDALIAAITNSRRIASQVRDVVGHQVRRQDRTPLVNVAERSHLHRERLIAVLTYEANSQGERSLARLARRRANLAERNSDDLGSDQHLPFANGPQAERDLKKNWFNPMRSGAGSETTATSADQLRPGESNLKLDAGIASLGSNATGVPELEPPMNLARFCRDDRPLVRKSIELVRQWFQAKSERHSAMAEWQWRTELVERLRRQTQPNPPELQSAQYEVEFCEGRIQAAIERAGLVRLLFDQITTLAEDDAACEVSLIGNDEASILLAAAEQRTARFDQSLLEQRIKSDAKKLESLRHLRDLGHASIDELARAELSLGLMMCEQDSVRLQRQIAELDSQIMAQLVGMTDLAD